MVDYIIPQSVDNLLGMCSWAGSVATKDYNDYIEEKNKRMSIYKKSDYYIYPNLVEIRSNGDTRLKNLLDALSFLDRVENGAYKRSKQQVEFHRAFIGSILKQIYGNDIYANLAKLLKQFDLDELRPDVAAITPRRFGKTTSVAMFAACVLFTQPDFSIDIYSTSRRASNKLLTLIYKFLCLLGDFSSMKHTRNHETLAIYCPYGGISVCNSYPSKVEINDKDESIGYLAISTII